MTADTLAERLRRLLSAGDMLELLADFEGRHVSLPAMRAYLRAEREAAIHAGWREGAPYRELARRHGLSERQVRRIVHGKL